MPKVQQKNSGKRLAKTSRAKTRKTAKPPSAIVKADAQVLSIPEAIEKVLILGDLSSLTPQDRVDYYKRVCTSLGLNPLTMPFSYILFREGDSGPAKLSLYANKSCTEQLRKIHGVSVVPPLRRSRNSDIVTVEADVRDKTGRTDSASGSVALYKFKDGRRIDLDGKELCNAEMKCETKAKRRATLSICGLAFLDESELDTMEIVGGVTRDGRIYYHEGEEPQYRGGSKEAAQDVLQKKLAAHAEGKPLDAQIGAPEPPNSGTHPSPEASKPASDGAAWRGNAPQSVPMATTAPPLKFKGTVEIDYSNESWPIVRGDLSEILDSLKAACPTLDWGKDEFWHIMPRDLEGLKMDCAKLGYKVVDVIPAKAEPEKKPAKAAPKQELASPIIVVGTIERVQPSSDASRAVITFATKEGKKGWTCFDKDIYGILTSNLGKLAEVIIQTRESKGKTYTNLVGLRKVGSTEYDSDGKTPIVQRNREAGGKTLF